MTEKHHDIRQVLMAWGTYQRREKGVLLGLESPGDDIYDDYLYNPDEMIIVDQQIAKVWRGSPKLKHRLHLVYKYTFIYPHGVRLVASLTGMSKSQVYRHLDDTLPVARALIIEKLPHLFDEFGDVGA